MVKPKLVYVSNTTEVGGVYTTAELEALRAVCDELGLYLYLDGARLSSALAAGGASLTDLGRLCDACLLYTSARWSCVWPGCSPART